MAADARQPPAVVARYGDRPRVELMNPGQHLLYRPNMPVVALCFGQLEVVQEGRDIAMDQQALHDFAKPRYIPRQFAELLSMRARGRHRAVVAEIFLRRFHRIGSLRSRIIGRSQIAREIHQRTLPAGPGIRVGNFFDRRTGVAHRIQLSRRRPNHAVTIGIGDKPEPALLRMPNLEPHAQMMLADPHKNPSSIISRPAPPKIDRPAAIYRCPSAYLSWRRTQSVRFLLGPVSLRPWGVRSRNMYAPRPRSSPRPKDE